LAAIVVPGGWAGAQASGRERILSFDVSVHVNADSTLDVEENIRVRANRAQISHGILRDFPTTYTDGSGAIHVVGFRVKSVQRDGKPETYSVSPWENGQRVKIGRPEVNLAPGEYTYAIAYQTDHQLGFFRDHDELYWNATGFWQFDIDKATATVILPKGVPPKQITVTAYTGPQGARGTAGTANVSKAGVAEFATTRPLPPNEGLTIVVGWPKGFVTPTPPQTEPTSTAPSASLYDEIGPPPGWWKVTVVRDAGGKAMILACLLLACINLAAWFAVGRDPDRRSITVQYGPPQSLSPAAIRYVRNLAADSKTFTSAVLSLASKKYLTIQHDGHTYTLVRTGKDADPKLSRDEEAVTDLLFTDVTAAIQARQLTQAQLANFSKDHPIMGQIMSGLAAALTGPADDDKTTRLRPYSGRIQRAGQALRSALGTGFPQEDRLQTNVRFVVLGVLYTLAAAAACLYVYPEKASADNWRLIYLTIAFLVANVVIVLIVVDRLAALLPMESFAPRRSIWKKIASAGSGILASALTVASGWAVALLTSVEWAAAISGMWLTVGIFQRLLKAPTESGQKLWDEIEGFRIFLSEVDQDRLDRMNPPERTPALFERMLPYAVALDCENAWAKQFESVLAMAAATQGQGGTTGAFAPSWYSGPTQGMTDLTSFTSSFSSSFASAIASSSAVPGSSSGGSGGGGGSSGGGGGGGGGGGW
jgi:uncharacterized membrane protein YgcG